jgi:hypothetical protein
MFEAKELGLMSGSAAGQQAQTIPAVCGPEGKGPDGNTYQAVAIPLPPGATPTGPTQTDPKTGQVYELALVPPGSCKDNSITITPEMVQQISKTQGMANAIGGSTDSSGSSSSTSTNGSGN